MILSDLKFYFIFQSVQSPVQSLVPLFHLAGQVIDVTRVGELIS